MADGMDFDDGLLERLHMARHVVVFTGAGISRESGIPTFREARTGLWERYDPEELSTLRAFSRDPDLVWGWYEWLRGCVMSAQPNQAHRIVAQMQEHVPQVTVITQNIDDLHERSGSRDVIHLHGSLFQPRCRACTRSHSLPDGIPSIPEGEIRIAPPRCPRCNGRIRPGVVWFGENLPASEWKQAKKMVSTCDVLFSVGTSSVVMPAASLPVLAAQRNAWVVQVNPQPTALDEVARFNLRGSASEVFSDLQKVMGWLQVMKIAICG